VDKVDNWIRSYNEQRPDSSGRCRFGRTPMRPFLDARQLARAGQDAGEPSPAAGDGGTRRRLKSHQCQVKTCLLHLIYLIYLAMIRLMLRRLGPG
jgi:hypothetical protein